MIATSGYRRRIAGHAHLAPPSPRRRALATSVRPMAELSPQPSVRHRPGRPVRRQFGRRQLRRRGATFRTSARPQPRFPTTSIRPNATTSIRPLTSNSLGTVWSLPSLVLDFCCLTPEHEDLDFAVQSAVQVQIQVLMAWASRRVYEFNRQPRLAHFEICLRHLPRGTSLARRYLSGPSLPRPIDQRRSRDPPADVPGKLRHHTRGHHFSAALPASQAAGAQNA